ncbi:dynein light chain Tctex-type 1-like [Protopterus annectens]|uniref:dynein light chain Tctex-type 1-like n=1 Tax=Protopterus annectens TaxID=7888 RepID=UPI001CFABE7C|nr:dynein light chain Tctex-type 1-like [Protopterus annectens]
MVLLSSGFPSLFVGASLPDYGKGLAYCGHSVGSFPVRAVPNPSSQPELPPISTPAQQVPKPQETPIQAVFVVEDVSTIIKEAVESTIGGNAYQHNRVNQWTSSVVETCLNQLTKLGKPFKYIVTCVIMQKNGAGLHTASSCFWDNAVDGSCTVRWENKTMYCIVSVFGLGV